MRSRLAVLVPCSTTLALLVVIATDIVARPMWHLQSQDRDYDPLTFPEDESNSPVTQSSTFAPPPPPLPSLFPQRAPPLPRSSHPDLNDAYERLKGKATEARKQRNLRGQARKRPYEATPEDEEDVLRAQVLGLEAHEIMKLADEHRKIRDARRAYDAERNPKRDRRKGQSSSGTSSSSDQGHH